MNESRKNTHIPAMKVCIMAGGGGTRLAPLSLTGEGKLPKQFLRVVGKDTLLQEAMLRIPDEMDISVIPEKRYSEEVYRQAEEVMREITVLEEPFGCNTATAVIYAALYEAEALADPERLLCFIPADHRMDMPLFRQLIQQAGSIAAAHDVVVTIGIEPDHPETQYGYIRVARPLPKGMGITTPVTPYHVERFVEKPDRDTAKLYLESGGYYWNAGIFVVRARVLLEKAARFCGPILEHLRSAMDPDGVETITDAYATIKRERWNISIDYALMERIPDEIVLLPAPTDLAWNDLGNWESLNRYMVQDPEGNSKFSADGSEIFKDCEDVMVCNYTDLPIRVEDCEDLLVVVTENGILVRKRAE